MTPDDFARRLAARAEHALTVEEATKLAANPFADIGAIPAAGDPSAAMQQLVDVLPRVADPFQFGRLVFYGGYLTEQGAAADTIAPIVAERLPWLVSLACRGGNQDPARLIVELALIGTMTLFCRDRPALRLARKSPELLNGARELGKEVRSASFLSQLLECSDQQRLVVIQPSSRRGVSVLADGVRNGFHLFALLEAALVGIDGDGPLSGTPLSAESIEIARGTRPAVSDHVMRARLDYFNWSAWDGGNWLPDAPTRWIWGELPLTSIPELEGQPLVLIEAPRYERSWDASLACALHPDHGPNVAIEQSLPNHQVARWLEIMAAMPAEARQRMRYAGVAM